MNILMHTCMPMLEEILKNENVKYEVVKDEYEEYILFEYKSGSKLDGMMLRINIVDDFKWRLKAFFEVDYNDVFPVMDVINRANYLRQSKYYLLRMKDKSVIEVESPIYNATLHDTDSEFCNAVIFFSLELKSLLDKLNEDIINEITFPVLV